MRSFIRAVEPRLEQKKKFRGASVSCSPEPTDAIFQDFWSFVYFGNVQAGNQLPHPLLKARAAGIVVQKIIIS